MTFRRVVQTILFFLFLGIILGTFFPIMGWIPVSFFAKLDPLLIPVAALSTKTWLGFVFLPVILLYLATLFLGRFFCSYVCPLGSCQDFSTFLGSKKARTHLPTLTWLKYGLLFAIIMAAIYGLNISHWGSPISLLQRGVVLLFLPMADFLFRPFELPLVSLMPNRLYTGLWVLLPILSAILIAPLFIPRFWCRYICPAGALLALLGKKPLMSRRVNDNCTNCGRCQKSCPMQAISKEDPFQIHQGECTTCLHCENICPEQAISFGIQRKKPVLPLNLPDRRRTLAAVVSGFSLAFLGKTSLSEFWPKGESGTIMPQGLIRPPGSKPEQDFLNLCTRCGLCYKVCPTNMLQPALLETGFSGMYSPLAMPRRGPCEPLCNSCGQVCPTQAIAPLPLEEKIWAKMGTAVIIPKKCLAWEFNRACLICDEACPFDAIELKKIPGQNIAVPFVDEMKCTGCGFCENRCPIQAEPAIKVTPMAAMRLKKDNYREQGRASGLTIKKASEKSQKLPSSESFHKSDSLPPGFSE